MQQQSACPASRIAPENNLSGVYILLSLALVLSIASCTSTREMPEASRGILDLSCWEPEGGGAVKLSGEWEFYWKSLLRPNVPAVDTPVMPVFVQVPGAWNDYSVSGAPVGREGYATYRLRIVVDSGTGVLAIKVPEVNTAYELWANGVKIAACGKVGTSRMTTTPRQIPRVAFVSPQSDTLELRLLVSNYDYALGGQGRSLSIGAVGWMMRNSGYLNTIYMLLFGILVLLGGYHIWLFIYMRHDRGYLFFGSLCLGVLLVSVFIGDHSLRYLVGSLPWSLTIRSFMVLVVMVSPLGALFFWWLCPEEFSKRVLKTIFIVCIPFAVVIAFIGMPWVHYVFEIFYIPNIAIILYGVFVAALGVFHRRDGVHFVLAGYVVHVIAIINDQLSYIGVIDSIYITPLGVAFWSLGSSLAINRKFIKSQQLARVQREKLTQSEKLAALGTLVSGVAHEINNPNNVIRLNAEFHKRMFEKLWPLLDDYERIKGKFVIGNYGYDELKDEIADSIKRTIRNTERIKSIVSDLRSYARKDDPKVKELVDCNTIVDSALRQVEHRTIKLTHALICLKSEGPLLIRADRQRLEQVVMNLVINACQALTNRSQAVRVTTERSPDGQGVCFSVADRGAGMDKEILARALDPFFTTKNPKDGTGLGLSICQTIVDAHKGRMEIHSEPGAGTIVCVTIPSAKPQHL